MKNINKYITLSFQERQKHLKLHEPCIERGGKERHVKLQCRGILAHFLDTSIPIGMNVHACHACNNSKCSNPFHLYWGTPKENFTDSLISGSNKTIWENVIAKHGLEKAKEISRQNGKMSKPGKHMFYTKICPHCKYSGNGPSMIRWHFDNCKDKTDGS